MNKKNKLLILLFILLNINFSNYSSSFSTDKQPNIEKESTSELQKISSESEKLSQFIKEQTQKKYFVPIATTTLFTLGTLMPVIMNHNKLTELTEIKKLLASIQKKDFALTGLKSLFVASTLTKEFKNKEKFNDYLQKLSFLSLLGVYTHKTITDLLKKEEPQNLGTLFEKLIENYGTIGVVSTAIKGLHNNNESLLKPSEINFVNKEKQKHAYYGLLITLMCLWEYGIQKNIISSTNFVKTLKNTLLVFCLTHVFDNPANDVIKKLLILFIFYDGIREFYKNSEFATLEKELTKSISLENITGNIGKQLALTTSFNGFINFLNENFFPKQEEKPKGNSIECQTEGLEKENLVEVDLEEML